MSPIILSTYKCNSCDVNASCVDNIQKHIDTIHKVQSVSMEQEFDWVLQLNNAGKSLGDLCLTTHTVTT